MRKLSALVAHLLAAAGIPGETCTSFADQGTLQPTGRHLGFVLPEPNDASLGDAVGASGEAGLEQLEVGVWSYEGVVQIERYPGSGPELLAHVLSWLAECDADRPHQDVKDPQLTIHLNDAETCDVELSVEFEEPLLVMEDSSGPIHYRGKRWAVCLPEITPARELAGMKGALHDA